MEPYWQTDLLPDAIVQILETACGKRSRKQRDELAKYFREEVDPVSAKLNEKLQELSERIIEVENLLDEKELRWLELSEIEKN